MDEIIKSLILQAPAVGIALYALYIVYNDWKKDRDIAAAQRDKMIEQLTLNTAYLQTIATRLNVPVKMVKEARSNPDINDVT